jgi:alpha-ribazole phosphatase/probable phosphoglycerate mutase
MSGWTDVPLTALGHRQAQAVASRLARRFGRTPVYASPLQRARQTAHPVAEHLGAPLRLLLGLREICAGAVDGWPVEAVRARFPRSWAAHERQEDDDFRWPEGESYRELRARVLRALRRIAAAHAGGPVVVVTHAGPITQVMGWIQGTPPARWSCHRAGNCSVTEVLWTPSGATVVRFDDRAHLVSAPSPPA